ncbi:hypothetical protein Tco_1422157, partial [Tanacetum coccineum]
KEKKKSRVKTVRNASTALEKKDQDVSVDAVMNQLNELQMKDGGNRGSDQKTKNKGNKKRSTDDASVTDKKGSVTPVTTINPDPQNLNPNQIPPRGSDDVIHTKRGTRSQSKDSSGLEYDEDDSVTGEFKEVRCEGDKGSVALSDTQSFDSRSNSDSVGNMGLILVPVKDNSLLNPRLNPVVSPMILKWGETLTNGGNRSNTEFSFNNMEKLKELEKPCGAIKLRRVARTV